MLQRGGGRGKKGVRERGRNKGVRAAKAARGRRRAKGGAHLLLPRERAPRAEDQRRVEQRCAAHRGVRGEAARVHCAARHGRRPRPRREQVPRPPVESGIEGATALAVLRKARLRTGSSLRWRSGSRRQRDCRRGPATSERVRIVSSKRRILRADAREVDNVVCTGRVIKTGVESLRSKNRPFRRTTSFRASIAPNRAHAGGPAERNGSLSALTRNGGVITTLPHTLRTLSLRRLRERQVNAQDDRLPARHPLLPPSP